MYMIQDNGLAYIFNKILRGILKGSTYEYIN